VSEVREEVLDVVKEHVNITLELFLVNDIFLCCQSCVIRMGKMKGWSEEDLERGTPQRHVTDTLQGK
jgi:hypothetical protein